MHAPTSGSMTFQLQSVNAERLMRSSSQFAEACFRRNLGQSAKEELANNVALARKFRSMRAMCGGSVLAVAVHLAQSER